MYEAAKRGCVRTIRILIGLGADVDTASLRRMAPIHLASWNNQEAVVGELIAAKANINAQEDDEETPLHLAARHGNAKIVALLCRAKAKTELKDRVRLPPEPSTLLRLPACRGAGVLSIHPADAILLTVSNSVRAHAAVHGCERWEAGLCDRPC